VVASLTDLIAKLRLAGVFLTDGTGRVVAYKKAPGFAVDSTVLSALAAGSYAATSEMARVLGEPSPFRMVLHEGGRWNVFLCSVASDFFLVVVFGSDTALGMIRLFVKRTVESIRSVLAQPPAADFPVGSLFGGEFESLLDQELERSFHDRRRPG
jgi:predicted regulator of Ras-like GTPase activity (Roadblock/LC7/MglB family)